MSITVHNLATVKATDVLAFMQSGDMGFVTGKDYILYAGSIDGKSITKILAESNSFGYMNVAHTTLGSLASSISGDMYAGMNFRQSVINNFFEQGTSFSSLEYSDQQFINKTTRYLAGIKDSVRPDDARFEAVFGNAEPMWDTISRRFVAEAPSGTNFRILTGTDGFDMEKLSNTVLMREELPALFSRNDVLVNGQEVGKYKLDSLDNFKFSVYSDSSSQTFLAYKNGTIDIQLLKNLENPNFAKQYLDNLPDAERVNFHHLQKHILDEFKVLHGNGWRVPDSLLKGLKQLSIIGVAISFSLAANEAEAAEKAGDTERAKEIMIEWGVGELGSEIASMVAGVALGLAGGAILSLSAPVAIVAGIAVGIAAGIWGEDAGKDLYKLTKDLDGNGKADIFDRMGELYFGKEFNINDIPEKLRNNVSILNANLSAEDLANLAKTDIAYRYALVKLNPFVFKEGIDYEKLNENGELDLYSKDNPNGLTQTYLEKRAEMLTAWINKTSDLPNTYIDIDQEIRLQGIKVDYNAGNNGVRKSQSEIIFGGDQDDIIQAQNLGDNKNFLFGGKGNDTLKGNDGEDYLEGNEGNDTLDGGEGNDLIVGGTGDDTLISSTGDDILKGGIGKDTYDFTTTTGTNHITTYGTNHVYDDDNNGIIKMSNRIVEVGEKITENVYLSKDKFFILTKVANHQSGSYDIIIRENNADIKGTVTLHNWKKDGDLGLKFAESPLQPTGYNLIDYADLPKGKIKGKAKVDEHNLFFTSKDFPENNDVVYKVIGGNKRDVIDFQNQKVSLKIEAGQGSDTIFAGEKDDIIWVDSYEEKTQMTPYHQLFYKWQLPAHINIDNPPLDTKLVNILPHDENNKIIGDWTDFADGGAGNDKIYGFYGRDTLYGGIGNDTLIGAGNKDEILGGEGNDLIHGDGLVAKQFAPKYWNTASNKFGYMIDREDRENYQKQNTQLDWDLIENHNIASGMGAYLKREEIMVNLAYHDDDLLSGGKGEDIIIGEGGNDIIDGGEDDDIIMGDNINIESLFENENIGAEKSFDLATETQSEKYLNKIKQWQAEFSGKDKLYGREGNDTIFAGSKSDYIEGNEGDDIIYADSDLLTTHIDNSLKQQTDFIHEYFKPETNKILRNQQTIFGDDKVLGGTGKDIIYGEGGNDTIDGGEDDDTLHGDANFFIHDEKTKPQHGNDKILGGLGKDTIYGGGGKDQIEAGDDDDIVYGDYSQDILDGKFHEADIIKAGLGNDKVWGQGESDTIHGEQGNDILVGDAIQSELDGQWHGNDILTGGEGEDTLYGTGGNDSLDGGDDNDYIRGDASDSQLTGNWHGNDIINGGQGDDMMSGDGGKDIIYGGEGNDEISGDEQDVNTQYHDDDTLSGGQGDDKIWGDAGNDTLNGDEGDDYLDGDAQYLDNQYHGKDNINGGQGDDIIYGRGNDDVINGGEGDDKIYADDATFQDKLGKTKGNDIVHGGLGSDIIYGGAGNDKLYGNEGNDYLIAGTGTDYLYGGEGEDGYFFYTETMQDNTTKYITDIDNLGQIILDDDNLTDNDWQIITPLSENYLKSWTDNQGNIINQTNEGYILTHEGWHSNIHILTQPSINNILLGITLPNNRHHILNHAPTINKTLETQIVNLNDNITISLPNDLFYDADNDNLTLTATLADGTALPTWLNFDGKTLTGTATQKQNLAIKITATDPQGEQISQTFNLQTNSRPIANNTLQTKYNIKAGQSWQLDLPKDTFTDNDDDKLSYSATLINGEPLPTGISIDSNTGQITSQSNQLGTYHINITATDPHGQTAQIQTTLNITDKLIESSQTLITGTFADDIILASNGKWHIINGLIGDDTITGGDKDDTINGGIGADTLYGLLGNDILNGGLGNDILTGGKGNDRLDGGFGNDIYHFYKGDGQDRIFDIQGNDTLQFGQGIGAKDIWFSKKGIDLQISLLNSDDTINIEGWFIMPNQRLENFTLATGETLSGNNIDNVIKAMNYHDQNMMNDSNFTSKIELYWEV